MVLQRDRTVPVWGTATAGAEVRVECAGQAATARADDSGSWRAELPALPAGGPHQMVVASGDEKIRFADVLVGEVWLASGQSNMEWPMWASWAGNAAVAEASHPDIRLVTVPHNSVAEPQAAADTTGWAAASPATVHKFSAVAYYFGRELHRELGVPVGLVHSSWGGSSMEAWTSEPTLRADGSYDALLEKVKNPPAGQEPIQPRHMPAHLYNGMIHPLAPYGIRGVIWYQGESNAARSGKYRQLTEMMLGDWRSLWGQADLPFLYVQLAGWGPGNRHWPGLREAQLKTLEIPGTAMAVAADLGNDQDIHPKNKYHVGKRLALAAKATVYGLDVEFSGPIYRDVRFEGGKAVVAFDHTADGLALVGGKAAGFQVCGADGKFVEARAAVDGHELRVWSKEVPEPTAVRYNWTGMTYGNLYNSAGLPASPFRTDDFDLKPGK